MGRQNLRNLFKNLQRKSAGLLSHVLEIWILNFFFIRPVVIFHSLEHDHDYTRVRLRRFSPLSRHAYGYYLPIIASLLYPLCSLCPSPCVTHVSHIKSPFPLPSCATLASVFLFLTTSCLINIFSHLTYYPCLPLLSVLIVSEVFMLPLIPLDHA